MEKAANIQRYFCGFMIGFTMEYLIRVKFNCIPAAVLGLAVFIMIVDMLSSGKKESTNAKTE